jgi:hypothetical protein
MDPQACQLGPQHAILQFVVSDHATQQAEITAIVAPLRAKAIAEFRGRPEVATYRRLGDERAQQERAIAAKAAKLAEQTARRKVLELEAPEGLGRQLLELDELCGTLTTELAALRRELGATSTIYAEREKGLLELFNAIALRVGRDAAPSLTQERQALVNDIAWQVGDSIGRSGALTAVLMNLDTGGLGTSMAVALAEISTAKG